MRKALSLFPIIGVLAATVLLGACVPPGHRVAVWGDSLTAESTKAFNSEGVIVHARGGTAPCDWQSSFPAQFTADKLTDVVFSFVGNHGTPCMAGTTSVSVLGAKYRAALSNMAGYAVHRNVHVYFIVPPLMAPNRPPAWAMHGDPAIGAMECSLASTARALAACDTQARDNLCPAHIYTSEIDGKVIRSTDGIHLTDDGISLYTAGVIAVIQA